MGATVFVLFLTTLSRRVDVSGKGGWWAVGQRGDGRSSSPHQSSVVRRPLGLAPSSEAAGLQDRRHNEAESPTALRIAIASPTSQQHGVET